MRSFKQLEIQYFVNFADVLATTQLQIDDSIFEIVSELNIPNQFPCQGALADAGLSEDGNEPPLLIDKLQNLMQFFASRNVMLHTTGQVFVVVGVWTQIVEILYFAPWLEMLFAVAFLMVANQHKFLALVLRKLSLQSELLLGEVESVTDGCFIVNAG